MKERQRIANVFEDLKTYKDKEFDTIFCDPPYQLGTKWEIGEDGRPKVKGKKSDFMNKWDGLDENTLDELFSEANRVTKDGGFVCMFGLYRQSMSLQYYATKNGFEIVEPLHIYFISNFPKASDLGKNIDKRNGKQFKEFGNYIKNKRLSLQLSTKDVAEHFPTKTGRYTDRVTNWETKSLPTLVYYKKLKEILDLDDRYDELIETEEVKREVVGKGKPHVSKNRDEMWTKGMSDKYYITKPSLKEAQIVDGLKYSVAPLKQVLETLYIFKKPNRTSVVDDTLDRLNGNEEVSLSALNIDASRVPISDDADKRMTGEKKWDKTDRSNGYSDFGKDYVADSASKGRFPANVICDEEGAKILDEQSGVLSSGEVKPHKNNTKNSPINDGKGLNVSAMSTATFGANKGGSSKILHKFNNGYENMEYDLLNYGTKVSAKERNAGMGDTKNTHCTLKSIMQIKKLFLHFILPKEINQKIYVPFSGTNSEVIGIMKAIQEVHNCSADEALSHITACEMSEEYVEIGKARLDFWKTHEYNDKKAIVEMETEKVEEPNSLFF